MMPAANDAGRLRGIFDLGFPDLLAGFYVNRHRGAVGGDIDHALVTIGWFSSLRSSARL